MTKQTKFPVGTKFDIAYPDIVKNNWDYDNNDFRPNEITYGSSRKKVSLVCDRGHNFSISPSNLAKGQWCGKCRKEDLPEIQRKSKFNSERTFGKINPDKVKFWSNKNKKSPYDIMCQSDDRVFLVCENNHHFDARACNITNGKWCPYCSGHKVNNENSFGFSNENRLNNWSSSNDKNPFEITAHSEYRAQFVCDEGHSFTSMCKDITRGRWCATCAQRPKIDNDILDNRIKDREVYRIGNYINARTAIKFGCKKCGSRFDSAPDALMNKGVGCPICCSSKGESKISEFLKYMGLNFKQEYSFNDLMGLGGRFLRFDFAVEKGNELILIEYDGEFHFGKIFENDNYEILKIHDEKKDAYCLKNKIQLIRIPYWDFDNIEKILIDNLS